jgi:hypothetical protein
MIRKPSRKFLLTFLAVALLLPLAALAAPAPFTDGDFESSSPGAIPQTTYTVGSNDGTWIAGSGNWTIAPGGPSGPPASKQFAQHTVVGADLLIQGFSIASSLPVSCNVNGWTVRLSFSYQLAQGNANEVEIAGFDSGGTWNPSSDAITTGQSLTKIINLAPTATGVWGTSSTTVVLPQNFTALGVGFSLDAVDNVVVELVAPVSLRITPNTLNAKSQGQWVTAFISNPPSCESLKNIDPNSILLTYAANAGFGPDTVNSQGHKFMLKFNRQSLITMLNGATGNVPVTITGNFMDGVAFAGTTNLHVIKPGKGPKK